jgi:hypothetical protein
MEGTMLTIKFVVFLALGLFVLSSLGAALITGLYQIVQDKVQGVRRLDGSAREVRPATRRA